jgi:hypothetical protein
MQSLRQQLETFSELGERHLFRLRDGRPFEGWIVEVGESGLLAMSAGPEASDDVIPIAFEDIVPSSLEYIDIAGLRIAFAAHGN